MSAAICRCLTPQVYFLGIQGEKWQHEYTSHEDFVEICKYVGVPVEKFTLPRVDYGKIWQ